MNHTRSRFFRRSFLRYMGLILLPLLIFSLLGQYVTYRSMTEETVAAERTMLRQMEASMAYMLDEIDAFVLAFEQESIFRTATDVMRKEDLTYTRNLMLGILRDWVKSLVNSRDYIDSIYIYIDNQNDRIIASDDGVQQISFMTDRDWHATFLEKRTTQTQWMERRPYLRYGFETSAKASQETVSLFRTIRSARGVIVLNLSPQVMQRQLTNAVTYAGQQFYVLNETGELLFASTDTPGIFQMALQALLEGSTKGALHHGDYSCTVVSGAKYGLTYVSAVPTAVLYRGQRHIFTVSIVLLLACILLCVIVAYRSSLRTDRRLNSIFALMNAANTNQPLPALPRRRDDEYSFIEQNILLTFLRQGALEKQLHEKEYQQKSLELLALQAQINPHFLVNTLNTIFWLAMGLTGGPNAVSEMIEDLTGLLGSLAGDPNEVVTLAEEAHSLGCYIRIQQKRFGGRLAFATDIAPDCAELCILRLVLQPLAENCITHALREDRVVHVRLSAHREGENAVIRVCDDGKGMSAEKAETLRAQWSQNTTYTHIGLANTVKRLSLFYGREGLVTLESELDQGTQVTIRLPLAWMGESPRTNTVV